MNVTPTINTKRLFKRTSRVKKIRKSFARYGVVSVNTILVMAMIGFLGYGKLKHDPQVAQTNNAVTATEQVAVLDEISSADIAANIAIAAKLPEADQVRNQADSRNALATIAVSNDTVVAKPQIITNETASSQSRSDIIEYTAQSGDTISSLAARYNVSSDSIRWSNGLSGDTIAVGNKVVIPPKNRNGIVYKVGVSDDIGKLAEKYKTTKDVADFMSSPYGKPIVTNSSIQLLLKQSPAAVDIIAETFFLTEGEKYLLLESDVGEGIFFAGLKHAAIKIYASYVEDQIITTDPKQLLEIEQSKQDFAGTSGQ